MESILSNCPGRMPGMFVMEAGSNGRVMAALTHQMILTTIEATRGGLCQGNRGISDMAFGETARMKFGVTVKSRTPNSACYAVDLKELVWITEVEAAVDPSGESLSYFNEEYETLPPLTWRVDAVPLVSDQVNRIASARAARQAVHSRIGEVLHRCMDHEESEDKQTLSRAGYVFLSSARSPFLAHKAGGRYRPRSGPVPDISQTPSGKLARRLTHLVRNEFSVRPLPKLFLTPGAKMQEAVKTAAEAGARLTKSYLVSAYSSRETIFRTIAQFLPSDRIAREFMIAADISKLALCLLMSLKVTTVFPAGVFTEALEMPLLASKAVKSKALSEATLDATMVENKDAGVAMVFLSLDDEAGFVDSSKAGPTWAFMPPSGWRQKEA